MTSAAEQGGTALLPPVPADTLVARLASWPSDVCGLVACGRWKMACNEGFGASGFLGQTFVSTSGRQRMVDCMQGCLDTGWCWGITVNATSLENDNVSCWLRSLADSERLLCGAGSGYQALAVERFQSSPAESFPLPPLSPPPSPPPLPHTEQESYLPLPLTTVSASEGAPVVYVEDVPSELTIDLLQCFRERYGRDPWDEDAAVRTGDGVDPPYEVAQYLADVWLHMAFEQGATQGAPWRTTSDAAEATLIFIPFYNSLSRRLEACSGLAHHEQRVQRLVEFLKGHSYQSNSNTVLVLVLPDYRISETLRADGGSLLELISNAGIRIVTVDPEFSHIVAELDDDCRAEGLLHFNESDLAPYCVPGWHSKLAGLLHVVPYTTPLALRDSILQYLKASVSPPDTEVRSTAPPRRNLLFFRGNTKLASCGSGSWGRKYTPPWCGLRSTAIKSVALANPELADRLVMQATDRQSRDDLGSEKGFDEQSYARELTNAEFCLVPRGDTASCRRLFEALVAGCVPVIVSDTITLPFKGILDWSKFSVQISESAFLADPIAVYRALEGRNASQMRSEILGDGASAVGVRDRLVYGERPRERSAPVARMQGVAQLLVEEIAAKPPKVADASSSPEPAAADFPRVFIVPLPAEFTTDLVNCSRNPSKADLFDYDFFNGFDHFRTWKASERADDTEHFASSTPSHPFGEPQDLNASLRPRSASFTYTPLHPSPEAGEYELDLYFLKAMQGYARRVEDPSEADLFFVPAVSYWRLLCHPKATSVRAFQALERRIADEVARWIQEYPAPQPLLPNFFSVTGMLCSCILSHCNPLDARPDLDGKVHVVSYDTLPMAGPSSGECTGRLVHLDAAALRPFQIPRSVAPYVSQLHGVASWELEERRPTLSLFLGTEKAERVCVSCGPCGCPCERHGMGACRWDLSSQCGAPPDGSHVVCNAGCANVRPAIATQARKNNGASGGAALLWPDESNTDHPTPADYYKIMLSATFCLQPPGDTLTRKSFYEGILLGCIPVVFRNDSQFLEQLAYSDSVPYREMMVALPAKELLSGELDIVQELQRIRHADVIAMRRALHAHGQRIAYAAKSTGSHGFNDFSRPDAFLMALRSVWRAQALPRMPLQEPAVQAASSPCKSCVS
eukprot:Transcript_14952.p1 GENE.Transcript_14952~~Transcript_14952.p1  ORF type:complete len:1141 (+),score=66.73 Transcript_14952:163-3585(+)